MAANKKTVNITHRRHREDAEWLSREICDYYYRKAQQLAPGEACDVGVRRSLRIELQNRCDINEVEAINILNGYYISEYVALYQKYRCLGEGNMGNARELTESKYDEEFLEWIHEKETKKKELNDFDIPDEDD